MMMMTTNYDVVQDSGNDDRSHFIMAVLQPQSG